MLAPTADPSSSTCRSRAPPSKHRDPGRPGLGHPHAGGGGLALTLRGGGARTLTLRLAVPLAADGARARLDFRPPRAAASSLVLNVPEAAIVEPVPGSIPAGVKADGHGGTIIEAAPGAGDRILIAWKPRVEATGAGAQARLAVSEQMRVAIGADTAQASDRMHIALLGGGVSTLALRLPAGVQLLNVSGSFVRDWTSTPNGGTSVTLVRTVNEPLDLALEMQLEPAADRLAIPEIAVRGAVRQRGTITMSPHPN